MTTQPPAQPAANPEQGYTTLTLNYWLSVFFSWIPALIFYFVEKGKNSVIDEHNRVNLNFQLVRTIVVSPRRLSQPFLAGSLSSAGSWR